MLDPTGGTVDHYFSWINFPYLAYEWENYRFVCAPINSSKKDLDDDVLDPYDVGDGWYQAYQAGSLTLQGLRDFAPLIAAAVEKQDHLV